MTWIQEIGLNDALIPLVFVIHLNSELVSFQRNQTISPVPLEETRWISKRLSRNNPEFIYLNEGVEMLVILFRDLICRLFLISPALFRTKSLYSDSIFIAVSWLSVLEMVSFKGMM